MGKKTKIKKKKILVRFHEVESVRFREKNPVVMFCLVTMTARVKQLTDPHELSKQANKNDDERHGKKKGNRAN